MRAFVVALASAALVAGCPSEGVVEPPPPGPDAEPEWPTMNPGTLEAGASSGYLDLPVGVPLTGFTARDRALGSAPGVDTRDSDYTTDFQASAGWQTAMPVQALWLTDGERHGVILRLDLIYSWDELTEEIGRRLSDATGIDLTDSVFTITSHSHSAPGTFTNATMFYLGSDVFSEEIFGRVVDDAVGHALTAFESRVPARAGLGVDLEFDPIGEDVIFSDRREENDHLLGVNGQVTGEGWKDQRATMLRVDSADGDPIAALFAFGIHGTVLGEDNMIASTDAPGHIAQLLQERFPGPVWIFGQGAGGDASPGGRHGGFARLEWLAEAAAERIVSLYDNVELSDEPLILEPLQRYVPQSREDIKVTRNGSVNLEYPPFQPEWLDSAPYMDGQVYDLYGNVASPIDEFWAEHGAALCGDPSFYLPSLDLGLDHPAYRSCLRLNGGFIIFRIAFPEYFEDRDTDFPLPLPSTTTAMVGALGIQGLAVTTLGENAPPTDIKDVVFAFAPGEPTTLWTQFLRARARAEKEVEEVVVLGYAMDHEGYLLTVEDWLQAGYEPSITVWGPLQGESIMEQFLELIALGITPEAEDDDWPDWPGETVYVERSIPTVEPDLTPEAGTVPEEIPALAYVRQGASAPTTAQPAATVRRMQDSARFVFWGNDPAMGNPSVHVEREVAPDVWEPLVTPAGNPVDDKLPDIIVTYTPLPLAGTVDDPDPVREHLYVAEWQAVDAWAGLETVPGLPLGRYRLVASGERRDPTSGEYPFGGIEWSLASDPFEVVPATVELELVDASDPSATTVRARYAAAPEGFRLWHFDRDRTQAAPLVPSAGGLDISAGQLPLTALGVSVDGSWSVLTLDLSLADGPLTVGDGFGNRSTLELP